MKFPPQITFLLLNLVSFERTITKYFETKYFETPARKCFANANVLMEVMLYAYLHLLLPYPSDEQKRVLV